ncbi:MAG: hypothetical protein K6G18_03260 [Treponema sp.]|nr:hypothetical protein [Treponema sp.]
MENKNRKSSVKLAAIIAMGLGLTATSVMLFSLAGRYQLNKSSPHTIQELEAAVQEHDWWQYRYEIGQEIMEAMSKARAAAESYADAELDGWVDDVMERVDGGFLDEYFGFWNTKGRELKALGRTVGHFFDRSSETAEEKLSRELSQEISDRIIRPDDAEARIKDVMDGSVVTYLSCLDRDLLDIREKYRVPTPDWNDYICSICNMTMDVDAKLNPIALKAAMLSGCVAMFASPVIVHAIFTKVAAKAGGAALSQLGVQFAAGAAAGTGAAAGVTASQAVPFVGLAVLAAVCIWDVVDYKVNAEKGRTMLRENILDYLLEVKRALVWGSEESIMSSIYEWESEVRQRIDAQ